MKKTWELWRSVNRKTNGQDQQIERIERILIGWGKEEEKHRSTKDDFKVTFVQMTDALSKI